MSLRWDGGGVRLVRVGQYCLMGRRVLSRDTNRESAMACRGVFVSKGVHVLRVFYARKQLLPSARLSHCNSVCLSVCLSHGWISQKRCKLGSPIFTVGCLKDSSFGNRKAFP